MWSHKVSVLEVHLSSSEQNQLRFSYYGDPPTAYHRVYD